MGPRAGQERGIARFGVSVLPHINPACNPARWLTRNEHDAEDLVQESEGDVLSPEMLVLREGDNASVQQALEELSAEFREMRAARRRSVGRQSTCMRERASARPVRHPLQTRS